MEQATELTYGTEEADALPGLLASRRLSSKFLHDLRNPLAAVDALLSSIEEEAEEAGLADILELVRDELGKHERLVSRVSQLLRRQAPRPVQIGAGDIAERLRGVAAARHPSATIELGCKGTSARIAADWNQLEQAMVEILDNAVAASDGQPVSLSATCADGLVELTVVDSGHGMSAKDAERAMDPFHSTWGGTGLGLPLALSMVDRHGGSLRITSTKGRGTTVTLRLPAAETST